MNKKITKSIPEKNKQAKYDTSSFPTMTEQQLVEVLIDMVERYKERFDKKNTKKKL